jgi:hypothetical protein
MPAFTIMMEYFTAGGRSCNNLFPNTKYEKLQLLSFLMKLVTDYYPKQIKQEAMKVIR